LITEYGDKVFNGIIVKLGIKNKIKAPMKTKNKYDCVYLEIDGNEVEYEIVD